MIWALHGAFGSASDWDDLAGSLDTEVRAVDLWSPEFDLSLSEWASLFNRLVREADTNPVLLGYSMGARLGLHALVDDAATWKRAVLVSAHPGLEQQGERDARRIHDDHWLREFDRLGWQEFRRAWNDQDVFASSLDPSTTERRDSMRRGLESWSLAEQQNLRPHLYRIQCPTLWVTGDRDSKFTALGSAVAADSGIPHRVVESAGHRVPWDQPAEFAELLEEFVAF